MGLLLDQHRGQGQGIKSYSRYGGINYGSLRSL
nr:MAG TPA: hypothetical protein [Siphoviridae sp. ctHdl3]